jgi:hypothetical protein
MIKALDDASVGIPDAGGKLTELPLSAKQCDALRIWLNNHSQSWHSSLVSDPVRYSYVVKFHYDGKKTALIRFYEDQGGGALRNFSLPYGGDLLTPGPKDFAAIKQILLIEEYHSIAP